MKKLTLSIGLLAGIISASAQDTTCTYFTGKRVIEFDYYMDTILQETQQNSKYHNITVKYGDALCLHLADYKSRVRKVITTFFDGSTREDVLDSKNDVYFTPQGATKVSVSKSKFFCKL
tara:strand:+ start:766 stop:1122 length:357 start_codon:yes stop_codon:yes gene_type:complete